MTIIRTANPQSGNVLIYILIAVALLAAFSYAVMQGGGQATSISRDKANLAAAEILEYGNTLSTAVSQLRLRGCREGELSFKNPIITTAVYDNASAPTDEICHIFSPAGGGISWLNLPTEWLDTSESAKTYYGSLLITDNTCINGVGNGQTNCNAGGTSVAELVAIIPFLQREICIAVNNKVNLGNTDTAPPVDLLNAWGATTPEFSGTFTGGDAIADTAELLTGQTSGCFQASDNPDGGFHFFQVLLAR